MNAEQSACALIDQRPPVAAGFIAYSLHRLIGPGIASSERYLISVSLEWNSNMTVSQQPSDGEVLRYECPHCQKPFDIASGMLGDTVDCPVCSKPFAVQAPAARPLVDTDSRVDEDVDRISQPTDNEHLDLVIHPVVFRRHAFGTLLCLTFLGGGIVILGLGLAGNVVAGMTGTTLVVAGAVVAIVGLVFLAKWFVESRLQSLTLTSERMIYRSGLIHRNTSELRHDDVRNLKIDQNLIERLFCFGDMAISSAGQDDMEIVIHDIPDPEGVAEFIRRRQ